MKAIYRFYGDTITLTFEADTEVGTPVIVGNIVGFTKENVLAGAKGVVFLRGIFENVTKASGALTAGQTVYIKSDGKIYNAPAEGAIACGVAVNAADADDTTCTINLVPNAVPCAANITALTDSTGGTPADTIPAAAGSAWTKAETDNAVASLADKINDILDALVAAGLMVAPEEDDE